MNATRARYALLVAADALQADGYTLDSIIADDGDAALMTGPQVIDALRIYASLLRPPAPEPSAKEQAAEPQPRTCPECPHFLSVHGTEGCVAASGCDCKRGVS